jgi:hypothetical protein
VTEPITFEVPLRTVSGMNVREHWSLRAKRVKAERRATAYRTPPSLKSLGPFLQITLTRRSPRPLDSDNLPGSMKGVRDQLAASLGIDDRSKLVRWNYEQATGEPGVLVSVEVVR